MFHQIFITEITTSELLVCRACLATDGRLYDMRQNRLMETFNTLLSTAFQVTDDMPHYLCNYCAALLLKYDTFRIKCINAEVLLKNAIKPNLKLTLENIKQIEHPITFRQSYIQIIDIDDTNPKSNITDNLAEALKEEFNDDDVNDTIDNITDNSSIKKNDNSDNQVNSILRDELLRDKNDTSANVLNTRKRKIKTSVAKKQTKIKVERQSESKTKLVQNEDVIIETINNDDFENTADISKSISSDTEEEVTIADLKMNSKSSECKRIITNSKNKKVITKKILKAKPNGNKKTDNVSKMYNMDEVNLSKEEQIKEIEERKNSEIYLQAEFKCEFCYKGFRLKETFNSHMMLHDNRSGKLICDICHCHFLTKKGLCKHKATHKKRFTCKQDTCKYVTKHLSQAREHYKWHGGVKHTCKHCGKECSGQTSYYHHLKLSHPTSDDMIRCEICGTVCSGPLGFAMHEKRTHKEMFSSECLCSGCDTQFYCSDAFKAHQGTDGLCDTLHKYCVRCGMSFETEELLKEHEIEQRKPKTMLKCEVCNKEFEGYTRLKKHQLGHAMSETKRLVCEICGKVLSNQHILNQHYLNKHSAVNPFKCTECPKSFRSVINLQLHTRIHTGERPHPCPHCPNTFRSVTNLRRHELVHTDVRPHCCEICSKAFKTKADCKAHIQSVHMKIHRPRVRRKYKKTE